MAAPSLPESSPHLVSPHGRGGRPPAPLTQQGRSAGLGVREGPVLLCSCSRPKSMNALTPAEHSSTSQGPLSGDKAQPLPRPLSKAPAAAAHRQCFGAPHWLWTGTSGSTSYHVAPGCWSMRNASSASQTGHGQAAGLLGSTHESSKRRGSLTHCHWGSAPS